MTDSTRELIVAEARSWIGTPFSHQAGLKGVGADCFGFSTAVALSLGLIDGNFRAIFDPAVFAYKRRLRDRRLEHVLDGLFTRVDRQDGMPGDAILFNVFGSPQHMGILGNYVHGGLSVIHAASGPAQRVVEHRLDDYWLKRTVRCYRMSKGT